MQPQSGRDDDFLPGLPRKQPNYNMVEDFLRYSSAKTMSENEFHQQVFDLTQVYCIEITLF
jgi:hypothetical protein